MKNTTELKKMSISQLINLFNVKVQPADTLTKEQINSFNS